MSDTTNPNDPQGAESRLASVLAEGAWRLLALQPAVQADEREQLVQALRGACAVRLVVECPRAGISVPSTVTLSVLDEHGGEREIRVLSIADVAGAAAGAA